MVGYSIHTTHFRQKKNNNNKANSYPEEKLTNKNESLISFMRWTRGRSQYGFGMRENAYGPANGGRVLVLKTCAGPISVFLTVVKLLPYEISLSYGEAVEDEYTAEYKISSRIKFKFCNVDFSSSSN